MEDIRICARGISGETMVCCKGGKIFFEIQVEHLVSDLTPLCSQWSVEFGGCLDTLSASVAITNSQSMDTVLKRLIKEGG